jgi:hypothetical protein
LRTPVGQRALPSKCPFVTGRVASALGGLGAIGDHNGVINRRVAQAHIGGIWNPVKPVDIGLEYSYGKRETLLGEKGDMSRINVMARYNLNQASGCSHNGAVFHCRPDFS